MVLTVNLQFILKNSSYLLVSYIIERALNAIAFILLARYLGEAGFGMFSYALAFATIAGYFSDLGLTNTLIREGSKKGAVLSVLVASYFKTRLVLGFITALVSIVIINLFFQEHDLILLLYWITISSIVGGAFIGVGKAYFQVIQKMQYSALIGAVSGFISALSLMIAVLLEFTIVEVAVLFACSRVFGGLFSLFILRGKINFVTGWDKSVLVGLGGFTLAGLITMLLPQLGTLTLERVSTLEEVGLYSAAYRFPLILYSIPAVFSAGFYPVLFRLGNEKLEEEHLNLSVKETYVLNTAGICITLPFILYPEWWIDLLFGPSWGEAAVILGVLSWIVIFQTINYPLGDALTTKGFQNRRTSVLLIAIVIGFLFYFVLGKEYGGIGGAFAAIIIETILLFGFACSNRKSINIIRKGALNNLIILISIFIFFKRIVDFDPIVGMLLSVFLFIIINLIINEDAKKLLLKARMLGR